MLGKLLRWADTYASRGLEGIPEKSGPNTMRWV